MVVIVGHCTAVQVNLAIVALEQGEYATALWRAQQLVAKSLGSTDRETWGILCLTGFMLVGVSLHEDGLRLYAVGTALSERFGIDFNVPPILRQHERLLSPARSSLGPERQATVEMESRALPVERAVALARSRRYLVP
jgi:hypothetical protein